MSRSIISKIFRRITINHSLSQSEQLTQATDIQEEETKMSINLPYVEGTSERLRRILRSHKMRSTFYTGKTLRNLLFKSKDPVSTEDKNNIVHEIDCRNCQIVYFGESNQTTDIQEEETKMSINLPYVEGTSERLRRILRSHKIRSIFYTGKTLRKLLCKPKQPVATVDKNNIVHEIDCSNCQAVYYGESKRSLKSRSDEHKRSIRNCDCDQNEIAKHFWEEELQL